MRDPKDPTAYEPAQVLVTVKTYPTPSQRHIETVCVAGVRLDTPEREWIRLYPIPFRTASFDYEFTKYQIIDVPIRPRGGRDVRPESFQPQNDKIVLGDKIDTKRKWAVRKDLLGPLVGQTTTCELMTINRETTYDLPAPSLGLIKPRDISLTVEKGKPWTPKQEDKVKRAAQPNLFTTEADIYNELQPPPYQIKVRYKCLTDGCRGHNQTIIDWEVGSSAYHWRKRYPGEQLAEALRYRWNSMMEEGKDIHFYVGNQHQYRHSFSILGTWYPKL